MYNNNKIITMTKMAIYDKREGSADRQSYSYFRHDYIYRKNLWNRLSAGLGSLILVGLYWIRLIFIEGADFFALDLQKHISDSIMFVVAVLAAYTVIGTIQATREYYLITKRMNRYLALLYHLERINEQANRQTQSDEEPDYSLVRSERSARPMRPVRPVRPERPVRPMGPAGSVKPERPVRPEGSLRSTRSAGSKPTARPTRPLRRD